MQFEGLSDEDFREIIIEEAKKLRIAPYPMDIIIHKANEYYSSNWEYFKSWFYTSWFKKYKNVCAAWALEAIRNENPEENQLYVDLESSKKTGEELSESDKEENAQINEIIDMLSTNKIFEHTTGDNENLHTLHEIIPKLTENQSKKLKECILSLKDYCDAEGIKSVLNGANKNDINVLIDFKETDATTLLCPTNYFIKRLELMTTYIEKVAKEKDSDERAFGEKYWIRSTGSDPHKDGEHALFLVNKRNQEGYENDDRKQVKSLEFISLIT